MSFASLSLSRMIAEHCRDLALLDAVRLEALCVEAFSKQRLDRVDRLTIIDRPGVPRTVASLVTETEVWA